MPTSEREDDPRRVGAEHEFGNDRKRTPPVSERPVEEPVDPEKRPQGEMPTTRRT